MLKKLLVILTGGTICSSVNEDNERFSDAENVQIVNEFRKSGSRFANAEFESITVLDILSENMTIDAWNIMLDSLRNIDMEKYCGVIILHGTDTLAYTSLLLSIVLAGCRVPVCLVSAQLPLCMADSNGNANFRAAAELILNGIKPNVYVVYRNSNGAMYAHYGAHLLQCENYSNDFFSFDMMKIEDTENACLDGKAFESNGYLIEKTDKLSPCVLRIVPYVGIDYGMYNLSGVRAVVHGTYHSDTVCVERSRGQGKITDFSVLSFLSRCKKENVQFFLAPCDALAYSYESTGDAIKNGAECISGMTCEMAYVKTLVGCALGYEGEELCSFINKSINHEAFFKNTAEK